MTTHPVAHPAGSAGADGAASSAAPGAKPGPKPGAAPGPRAEAGAEARPGPKPRPAEERRKAATFRLTPRALRLIKQLKDDLGSSEAKVVEMAVRDLAKARGIRDGGL